MAGDEQTRSPSPRRRQEETPEPARRGSSSSSSRSKGLADVAISDGRVTIKTGTLIAIIGAVLGTGGGTGLVTLLDRPNAELLDRVEALEEQVEEYHRAQEKSIELIHKISEIIEQAHPVTRHGVPGTVSPLETVTPP